MRFPTLYAFSKSCLCWNLPLPTITWSRSSPHGKVRQLEGSSLANVLHLSVFSVFSPSGSWFLCVCCLLPGDPIRLVFTYLYEFSECSSENGKLCEFGEILTAIFLFYSTLKINNYPSSKFSNSEASPEYFQICCVLPGLCSNPRHDSS